MVTNPSQYSETPDGILIIIKVIPKSKKSEFAGLEADAIKIRLAAVPEKGQANAELVRFLAKVLGVAKQQVTLVSGEHGRRKKVLIRGVSEEQVRRAFSPPS